MTKYPQYRLHNTFAFGKYKGEGIGAVIEKDAKYVQWAHEHSDMFFSDEVLKLAYKKKV